VDANRGGRPRDPGLDQAILRATRRRLVQHGYSQLTIADIAADAGVTRPTIYRRWPGKLDLVSDALDYTLETQQTAYDWANDEKPPFERFREVVRRIDPSFTNPDAIVLQGDLIGETDRTPDLLRLLTDRTVEPRLSQLETLLAELKEQGTIRPDTDIRTVTTMCFGAFFGAHVRGDRDHATLADKLATELWAGLRYSPQP
jgi:AcrR family transcriptional regulator